MNETTNNGGNKVNNQFVPCDAQVLVQQIGLGNILAISGGRIGKRETGITLPVSNGYSVTVDLAGNDTYTVRRVFTRAGKVSIKGEVTDVYCDNVGEVAYQAHAFRSYEFPEVCPYGKAVKA
jgi:hypothetical protein